MLFIADFLKKLVLKLKLFGDTDLYLLTLTDEHGNRLKGKAIGGFVEMGLEVEKRIDSIIKYRIV